MKRRCAWCGRDLGLAPPPEDPSFTHGICLECGRTVLREAGLPCPWEAIPEAENVQARTPTGGAVAAFARLAANTAAGG